MSRNPFRASPSGYHPIPRSEAVKYLTQLLINSHINRNLLILNVTGIPGSGKTTLIEKLWMKSVRQEPVVVAGHSLEPVYVSFKDFFLSDEPAQGYEFEFFKRLWGQFDSRIDGFVPFEDTASVAKLESNLWLMIKQMSETAHFVIIYDQLESVSEGLSNKIIGKRFIDSVFSPLTNYEDSHAEINTNLTFVFIDQRPLHYRVDRQGDHKPYWNTTIRRLIHDGEKSLQWEPDLLQPSEVNSFLNCPWDDGVALKWITDEYQRVYSLTAGHPTLVAWVGRIAYNYQSFVIAEERERCSYSPQLERELLDHINGIYWPQYCKALGISELDEILLQITRNCWERQSKQIPEISLFPFLQGRFDDYAQLFEKGVLREYAQTPSRIIGFSIPLLGRALAQQLFGTA